MKLQDWNFVIGGVRARQRRLKRDTCTFSEDLLKWHRGACYSKDLSEEKFGEASRMTPNITEGFSPSEVDTTAFDIHLDAAAPLDEIMAKCDSLWNAAWIDQDTYSLELESGILNIEVGVFGKLSVGLAFKTGGRIVRFITVKLQSCSTLELFPDMIPELVWFGIIFCLLVRRLDKSSKPKRMRSSEIMQLISGTF